MWAEDRINLLFSSSRHSFSPKRKVSKILIVSFPLLTNQVVSLTLTIAVSKFRGRARVLWGGRWGREGMRVGEQVTPEIVSGGCLLWFL